MAVFDDLADWPSGRDDRYVTSIVMMGMGEPLYNYDNVRTALKIIMDEAGIALSRRRITLSTTGIIPQMQACGEELAVNLALSLHAVTDALRDELVPINRKYPIAEVLAACRALSRHQRPPDHLRIRHVERRQRQPGRRRGPGQIDRRHPGQGQSDPVQPVARLAL